MQPRILYEDNHLLAVCKPAGMLAQGDDTGDASVVTWAEAYLKEAYQKPGAAYVGLVHRLDRPVGGVLLLAKTSKAAARLSTQFQARQVQKVYLAVTARIPPAPTGTLRHFIGKLPGKNTVRAYDEPVPGAQLAELHYTVLATAGGQALIEVRPITGRRHQIRVQLARVGAVIAGDVKYGKTAFLPDKSIALFAYRLQVVHPTLRTPISFSAVPAVAAAPWQRFSKEIHALPSETEGAP